MIRHKAQLVAKGFRQVLGVDYFKTFASVAKYTTIRTVLTLAAARNLEIFQLDIVTAYLHGELSEEVFM